MAHLNYNHLYYFWVVARKGSIARASETLYVTPQTISGQLRTLEETVDAKLFRKQGRGLALTEVGQLVYRYAEEIFGLGRELQDVLKGSAAGPPAAIAGRQFSDLVPKLIAYRVLQPTLSMRETTESFGSERVNCRDDFVCRVSRASGREWRVETLTVAANALQELALEREKADVSRRRPFL